MDYRLQDFITDASRPLRADFEMDEGQPSLLGDGHDNPDYTAFIELRCQSMQKFIEKKMKLKVKFVDGLLCLDEY